MVTHVGQVVGHDRRLPWIVEPRFDLVEAEDAIYFGDVKVAVAHRHPVGHEQVFGERVECVRFPVAIVVAQRIDPAGSLAGAHEDRPVLTPRQ